MLLLWLATIVTVVLGKLQVHDKKFTPDHVLRVTAGNITVNCETRHSVIVNGTSPGPPLRLKEGKRVWIRVYNDIENLNITVHWHGLSQRTAPFSDGTPQVSQWPIPPEHFFDYEVYPDNAGTYFYHTHIGFESISAYGPLIVEDCGRPPYKYDEDITLSFADYYRASDQKIEAGLLANPFVWSGETNAILFNGQSGTALNASYGYDKSCAPYVLKVKPDTTYRMRFIGATAITLLSLGIEGHKNLTIIEADGADSKEYDVDRIQLASGQRFSILLHTKSREELATLNSTNFWIRYENRERPANVSGYAILSYEFDKATPLPTELPTKSPVELPRVIYDWLEHSLTPINPKFDPMPVKADRTITIQTHQYGAQNSTGGFITKLEWGQNGNIWQPHKVATPYLVDFYLNGGAVVPNYRAAMGNGGWDPRTLAFPGKVGEVVDIIWESNNLPTGGWDIHPFHAHGVHYWDLGSGNGTYNATHTASLLEHYTPIKRDTTMLYRYATSGVKNTTAGYRVWRLRLDEAGAFMLHCHILQHSIMGMSTVWVIGNEQQLKSVWPKPPYVAGYLEYGGSAFGNETYAPVVNEWWEEAESIDGVKCSSGYGYKSPRGLGK